MSITSTNKDLTAEIIESLRNQPEIVNDKLRAAALETFVSLGLPTQKHEEFKYCPITRELEKQYNQEPLYWAKPLPGFEKSFAIGGLDAYTIMLVNGKFDAELSNLPTGPHISIIPLKEALVSSSVASAHFAKITDYRQNAFTAWNTAAWTNGLFIHVAQNSILDKPLVIHHINSDVAGGGFHINRNLIVCGNNSEATIVEKFDCASPVLMLHNLINEVQIGENATFNMYSIQNSLGERHQYCHTEIYQEKSSRVNTYTFTLSGKLIRNNLQLILDGEGIESHMYGLYLLAGNTLADNHTVVDHRKPNSFSNELYKGVMDGSSKGVFNGKIYVRPQAQKTNAFQANRNILLTDKATVNTKPQLEIWADDVKCSHGCTSGQLDDEAVFYLRTRGINKETAQAMMLYAFAGEVLEQVKNETLKTYLNDLISERLHKNF